MISTVTAVELKREMIQDWHLPNIFTSKLNNFEDIYLFLSYGFRGEALASISAISKVDINTRTRTVEFPEFTVILK